MEGSFSSHPFWYLCQPGHGWFSSFKNKMIFWDQHILTWFSVSGRSFSLLRGLLFLLSIGFSLFLQHQGQAGLWIALATEFVSRIHKLSILELQAGNFPSWHIWWVPENVRLQLLFICDIVCSHRCSLNLQRLSHRWLQSNPNTFTNTGPQSLIHNSRIFFFLGGEYSENLLFLVNYLNWYETI